MVAISVRGHPARSPWKLRMKQHAGCVRTFTDSVLVSGSHRAGRLSLRLSLHSRWRPGLRRQLSFAGDQPLHPKLPALVARVLHSQLTGPAAPGFGCDRLRVAAAVAPAALLVV